MRSQIVMRALALALVGVATGCAATPEGEIIADPYEQTNRTFHTVNKGLDTAVVRPVAQAYDFATPALIRHLVSNFLEHLALPADFANYVLQGDVDAALETFGRFGVNTIAGAGGLLDPATEFGLPYEPTDFGMTLADWGADEGVYLSIPLLGPATTRDAFGRVVDIGLDPFGFLVGTPVSVARRATEIVDERADNFELVDELLYESEDSYTTVRTTYVLNRRSALAGDEDVDPETLPDIFAE